jgi:APA family basic amino acid/polyamine antiporter
MSFAVIKRKLFRTKKIEEEGSSKNSVTPTFQWYDLIAYGIASTVGSGVYAVVGETAHNVGPSVSLSIGVAGLISIMTALCYLEFASLIPTSGSSYSYSYATLGELVAWFAGWNLTLEYALSAAFIAIKWGEALGKAVGAPEFLYRVVPFEENFPILSINVIAGLVVLLISVMTYYGMKASTSINNGITVLNLSLLVLIIGAGFSKFNLDNISPFLPEGKSIAESLRDGVGEMFFCFVGFDAVCSLVAEAKKPKRDIPIAIFSTIFTAVLLYVLTCMALCGMVPYQNDSIKLLGTAFDHVGLKWVSVLVTVCSLLSMFSTMLASVMGQPRVFFSLAEDGLLPKAFARSKKGSKSSDAGTFATAALTLVTAIFLESGILVEMISFGILFLFSIVCSGLLILRSKPVEKAFKITLYSCISILIGGLIGSLLFQKAVEQAVVTTGAVFLGLFVAVPTVLIFYVFIRYRKELAVTSDRFTCPLMPLTPLISLYLNVWFMGGIKFSGMQAFAGWTLIGLAIYFFYGMNHSLLGKEKDLKMESKDTIELTSSI